MSPLKDEQVPASLCFSSKAAVQSADPIMRGPKIGCQPGSGLITLQGCLSLASSKLNPPQSVVGTGRIGMSLDQRPVNLSALISAAHCPKQFGKS